MHASRATTPEEILRLEAVSKSYGAVRAVDGLDLSIREGEIFALLGPNGAGKSTTVRLLMGIHTLDSGTLRWRGLAPGHQPPPAQLAYLPEDRGLWQDLPVLRSMETMGVLRRMRRADARRAALSWLQRFELSDRASAPLRALSKGNQQKIQFAAAILHGPRFAVLDEPFSGLDPLNQERFLDLIRELRDAGTTVLLSAHQMDLVERLADRALLIARGRAVLEGSIDELRRSAGPGTRLRVRFGVTPDPAALRRLPSVLQVDVLTADTCRLGLAADAPLGPLLSALGTAFDPVAVHSEEARLHEVFVHHTTAPSAAHPPDSGERRSAEAAPGEAGP